MIKANGQTKSFPSAVEVVVIYTATLIAASSAAFPAGFSGFWTVMPVSAVSLLLAIFALIRSRRLLSVSFFVVALLIAMPNVRTVGKMFPLRYPVAPGVFKDETVADVLQHIAKSNNERPYWRFRISTRALANRRVSLTLTQDSRLSDALDLLMKEADARYEWYWHKSCGNEPSPLCASFYISNGQPNDETDFAVIVDRELKIDTAGFDDENGRTKQ